MGVLSPYPRPGTSLTPANSHRSVRAGVRGGGGGGRCTEWQAAVVQALVDQEGTGEYGVIFLDVMQQYSQCVARHRRGKKLNRLESIVHQVRTRYSWVSPCLQTRYALLFEFSCSEAFVCEMCSLHPSFEGIGKRYALQVAL